MRLQQSALPRTFLRFWSVGAEVGQRLVGEFRLRKQAYWHGISVVSAGRSSCRLELVSLSGSLKRSSCGEPSDWVTEGHEVKPPTTGELLVSKAPSVSWVGSLWWFGASFAKRAEVSAVLVSFEACYELAAFRGPTPTPAQRSTDPVRRRACSPLGEASNQQTA